MFAEPKVHWLKLKLLTPVSHHDASQHDKSNVMLFRRQKQFLTRAETGRAATEKHIAMICKSNPVPEPLKEFFDDLTFEEFVGVTLAKRFMGIYGGLEGEGLFSGMERYRRLEERFAQCAIQTATLFEFWGVVCDSLQVGLPNSDDDHYLLELLSIPSATAGVVLHKIATLSRPIVMLAREWHNDKGKSKQVELTFNYNFEPSSAIVLDVPSFSPNSVRHELIREPGMWHLLSRLGIGFNGLRPSVAALLYNGGSIEKNAKAPDNHFALSQVIMNNYPLMGLIGGSTSNWILGESTLALHTWIICKENNAALELANVKSNVSIFDLIDQENMVHMTHRVDASPMPYSFETLVQGAEIMVRLALSPYATELEEGAMVAAVESYCAADSTVGGQRARGFGLSDAVWHEADMNYLRAAASEYENYLNDNRIMLERGLSDGTLGTGKVVCV